MKNRRDSKIIRAFARMVAQFASRVFKPYYYILENEAPKAILKIYRYHQPISNPCEQVYHNDKWSIKTF